jgi:hypothetical protein
MDQWTNRDDEELRNRCEYREARKVAGLMERLYKIIALNPGLVKHCGSLCYTHTPVNVYNELRTRSEVEEAIARREARREELGSDYDSDDDGEPKWDYQTAYLPTSSLIDKMYSCLTYVTDFQFHCENTADNPSFSLAISSFPTSLRSEPRG